jgi:hypothetical protein
MDEIVAAGGAPRRSVQFVCVAEYLWPGQTSVDRQRAYASVVSRRSTPCAVNTSTARFDPIEFVGAVVENGADGYWTSVGSGCSGQDTRDVRGEDSSAHAARRVLAYAGAAAASRDLFSPDDVDLSRSTGRDFYLITPRGEIRVLRPSDVGRIGAIGVGRVPASRATIGHAVKPNIAVDVRMTKRIDVLPSESRGDAPIG